MKTLIHRIAFSLSLFMAWPLAHAEPLINGLSSHQELGKERFVAALYSDTLTTDAGSLLKAKEHKRMELRITTKRLSARRLNSMWIEGMAINAPGSILTAQADNMVKFTKMVKKKLVAGDHLTMDYIPGEGTHVSVNGVELGTLEGSTFFQLLLRTWIGSVPLSSDFREQLLKGGDVDMELLSRYEGINPSAERAEEVSAWTSPSEEPSEAKEEIALEQPEMAAPETAPTIAAPTLAAAPAPEEPAPAPAEESVMSEDELDEEELEDEGPAMTAESLLSQQLYYSKLRKWVYKYLQYPKKAVTKELEGSVRISVTINRKGKIKDIARIMEAEHEILTEAAVKAIKKAAPFPPVPDEVAGETYSFNLPITFRLPK